MKIFDLYDVSEVKVEDPALKNYIKIDSKLIIKSHGRHTEKFGRSKMNIVERLATYLGVPGHRGRKQKIMSSSSSGKYSKNMQVVLAAFKIIEEKTKQNPVQVLIKAIENASPCDEVTTIEYGGARYPQAVDVAPTRRISLALRNLVHGSCDKSFGKKSSISESLANEIILASQRSSDCFAFQKRVETEKQADAAR